MAFFIIKSKPMNMLNLPILNQLLSAKNILLVGMGGGYDIFCGMPLYHDLRKAGKNVLLGNLTTSQLPKNTAGEQLNPHLVGIGSTNSGFLKRLSFAKTEQPIHACEQHLVEFLANHYLDKPAVWCFERTGVQPMVKSYQQLIQKYEIDTVVLVDGGVDSLIKGDENEQGTLIEDVLSIAAVHELKNVDKYLVCLGFGTERDIFYGDILENIAALTKIKAFLGSCALLQGMDGYDFYEKSVLFAQNHKDAVGTSVVNSSVISAARGEYGNVHLIPKTEGSLLWINPLMNMFWCFDLDKVAQWNLVIPFLKKTQTFDDVLNAYQAQQKLVVKRNPQNHIRFIN
jgi:hypothetical protein